jgi:hypothetical protein
MFKKVVKKTFGLFILSILLVVLGACDLNEESKLEKIEGIKPPKAPILRQIEKPEETLPQLKRKLATTLVWNSELKQSFDYGILDALVSPYTIWKPRRHFGPFFDASDFSQIQIWVNGSNINWYHNNYFTFNPDSAIYQKYYYTTSNYQFPPTEQTPSPENGNRTVIPGRSPTSSTAASLGNVLLTLHSISYSSLYGGSIRLLFYPQDDTEIELRSGDTRWDIDGLSMSIYVIPHVHTTLGLNPPQPLNYMYGEFYIDFDFQDAVRYTGSGKQIETSANFNDLRLALIEATSALNITQGATRSFKNTAMRFAYGFFHSQFQSMIGPNDAVDSIELRDGYADIWTHEREPVFSIMAYIRGIYGGISLAEWDNEYRVTMSANHIYSDGTYIPGPSYTFDMDDPHESSPIRYYGTWLADECGNIVALEFKINIVERDPIWDDDLEPIDDWLELADLCTAINQAVANNEIGTIERIYVSKDLVEDGDEWGSVSFEYRLVLNYR